MMQHQLREHPIKGGVGKRRRIAEGLLPFDLEAGAPGLGPRAIESLGIGVKSYNPRLGTASLHEHRERAGAAADLEDPLSWADARQFDQATVRAVQTSEQ